MNEPTLAPAFRDRRLWVMVACAVAALAAGTTLIPDAYALGVVSHVGYWMVLAAFILFVRALWLTFKGDFKPLFWRSFDWVSVAVVGLGGTVLLVHETFGFKIVMDEVMLLGTSMSMHLDRTVMVPMRGNDIQGAFRIVEGTLDKRPAFYPFLVSILHDLTGYRPANAFIVNGGLTFVFLALVNAAGRALSGRKAGWLGVALFAGLPLLAQNSTGGGFELLNLVMILATLLLGARFAARRDETSLTAFWFSALLMIQVRYESGLFMLPVLALVLWVWWLEGRAILSWTVILSPLLLFHCPLQTRVFNIQKSSWQLASKPGHDHPFSIHYVGDNLVHAARFFFGKPIDQPDSWVLSILGVIAVALLLLTLFRQASFWLRWAAHVGACVVTLLPFLNPSRLKGPVPAGNPAAARPIFVALAFFTVAFALHFALMMAYFWGQFDDPVIRRLSLPTHLWMVLAVMAVLPELPRSEAVTRFLLGTAVVGILIQGVPSMAAHAYEQEYLAGLETAWRVKFVAQHPRKDYLMIDNDSVLWVVQEVSATPVLQAILHRDALEFLMRNHGYSDILVFQRYTIDPDTGRMTLRKDDDLGPAFVLEPVTEQRLMMLNLDRISRITAIREGKAVASRPDPETHVVPQNQDAIDKARQAYLENFLKELP